MALVFAHGQMVAQRYRLERLLGEGGMGAVWAATHQVTRKPVALKFLKGVGASRPDVRRRFLREARAASAVRHPNVVQIHDIFELDSGEPVMVMDLLLGESLGARLRRVGKLTPEALAAILVPVISAVGTAHAVGIVHRDLKPDNIFIVRLPDGVEDVRVLDFGIAKLTATEGDAAQTGGITQTGDMLGTPYYMAPEQISGESDIDHRADIWGLGVIVYECLTGQRPIQGANLGQILKNIITRKIVPLADVAPELPPELTDMVGRMLAHDRAGRPADLREVRALFDRYTDVGAQSFGGARSLAPLADTAAPAPAEEPLDPLGSTTPSDGAVHAPVPSPPPGADPRWRAATMSVDSGSASDPSPETTAPRSWLPVWIGVGCAAIGFAFVFLWLQRQPPAPQPAAGEVAPTVAAPAVAAPVAPPPAVLPIAEKPVAPVTAPAAPAKPAATRKTKRTEAVKPPAATPAAPPPVEAPKQRLPGGVPVEAPF